MRQTALIAAFLVWMTGTVCTAANAQELMGHRIEPDIGEPLRDASICRGPGGTFYLTGTTKINTLEPEHADFQNNDGVRLWTSEDARSWEDAGLVWNFATDPEFSGKNYAVGIWQTHMQIVPGRPDLGWCHGATSPEIHYLRDTFWILFSMNDKWVGLLKSKTGEAEGPYEEVGQLDLKRSLGADGSFFVDDGPAEEGAKPPVYLVWGEGYIARMEDDMSGLAEKPRSLQMTVEGYPMVQGADSRCGARGASLFKRERSYYLTFAAWNLRGGRGYLDTLICRSESIYGPYSEPRIMVPDGGQASVWKGEDGTFRVTYSKDDHPLVEPLEWRDGLPAVQTPEGKGGQQ